MLLDTGTGYWNPAYFVLSASVVIIIVYLIRQLGEKEEPAAKSDAAPFYSGELIDGVLVRPDNLYWGFFKLMIVIVNVKSIFMR